MKHPYICCNCQRTSDTRPKGDTCKVSRGREVCKGRVIHVPTWEADMLANARQIQAQIGRVRLGRATKC